jgi:hypothetical protein
MARRDDDQLDTAVPEADRLEQEQQADPSVGSEEEWPVAVTPDADEADQLEQAHQVPGDPDEEHSPEPSGQ